MKIVKNVTTVSADWADIPTGDAFEVNNILHMKLGATFQRGGKDYNSVNLEGGSLNLVKAGTTVRHVKDALLKYNG